MYICVHYRAINIGVQYETFRALLLPQKMLFFFFVFLRNKQTNKKHINVKPKAMNQNDPS